MKPYDHTQIEKKWQARWKKSRLYRATEDAQKSKFYVLDMFPYPSGDGLHTGHPKGYIATDIYSRFKRMQGYSVLHPMGFDAFGLPAENYALQTKTHPEVSVKKNVKHFKEQLSLIGFDYDWDREINTTDPEYYRWTQWIFLQLYKAGLAYESNEPINWCPSCKTGLANEDVEDGCCERCGTQVEKKPVRQWVLKITDYAEKLLEGLTDLDWPESIKELQRNWIGKSEGSEIEFRIKNKELRIKVFTTRPDTLFGCTYLVLAPEHSLLAKDGYGLGLTNYNEVLRYVVTAKNKAEIERTAEGKEKTGVELKGVKAINPANKKEIPIFVADYVLGEYGTGAIMAVPAHDERDWEFARKYSLPIKEVILPLFTRIGDEDAWRSNQPEIKRPTVVCLVKHWSEDKFLFLKKKLIDKTIVAVAGGIDDGEDLIKAGQREVREETGYLNTRFVKKLGLHVFYRFYSVIGNQNRLSELKPLYFELINGDKEEISPEEKKQHDSIWLSGDEIDQYLAGRPFNRIFWNQLKGEPEVFTKPGILTSSGQFDGMQSEQASRAITEFVGGKMVTRYKLRDWVFSRQRYWGEPIPLIHCEKCALLDPLGQGVVPVPEEDLPVKLPKVKSYEPTGTGESPLAGISKWVNVKCPTCGGKGKRETNTMPQWAGSSWYWLRYTDPKNKKVFADRKKLDYWLGDSLPFRDSENAGGVDFYVGGAEHATRHLIYGRFWHRFLFDKGFVSKPEPFKKLQHVGLIMGEDGRKMSKRWGNVVDPDDIVTRFGADSLRLYEMFMGPFDQAIRWNTNNLVGARRFVERVWNLQNRISEDKTHTDPKSLQVLVHKTIKKVTEDISDFKFNTAVSQLMILVNECEKQEEISVQTFKYLLLLLAPFAPHISEELWSVWGTKVSIHAESWPSYDASSLADAMVTLAVQINGKVRATITVSPTASEREVLTAATLLPEVARWIERKPIQKVIYIPGRILSILV